MAFLLHQSWQSDDFELVGRSLTKIAGPLETALNLSGTLYGSSSRWLLLSVPNDLVKGVFSAMDEPGVELPPNKAGKLNAHISVMRPEELETIGGLDKITERGKRFRYTIRRLVSCNPSGWAEIEKCWMIEVNSPELKQLRTSYGLSPLPNDNRFSFHITCAVRRKKVLQTNTITKTQLVEIPA